MINILNMDYKIHDDWCKDFYSKYINENDKVCVLAFSYRQSQISNLEEWSLFYGPDEGSYYKGIVEAYMAFGINEDNISFVNYYIHSIEQMQSMISESTILYLPGGIPTGFFDKIIEKDLLSTISNYEGVVIGCSAGAMIQMDEYFISPDKDYPTYSLEKGMGLLSGFGVEAHFSNEKHQLDSIYKYINDKKLPVYGLSDDGVLVVEKDKIILFGSVEVF
ncbi:hypothetical protein BK011_04570 [Tenericutes bacterium MZ-XQ]|nr:hypothetical protein BK011_04570 [Tenericutes bacterium MZ-XQ]